MLVLMSKAPVCTALALKLTSTGLPPSRTVYSPVPCAKVTRSVAGVMVTVWVLCVPSSHPLGAASLSSAVVSGGMSATLGGMLTVKLPVLSPLLIVMVAAARRTYASPEATDAVTSRSSLGAAWLSVMPTSTVPSVSRNSLVEPVNMTVGAATASPSVMVMLRVAVSTLASGTMPHPAGRVPAANTSSRVPLLAISVRDVTVSVGADVPVGSVHVVPLRLPPETARL